MATTIQEAQSFVDKLNNEYQEKHALYEEQFWGTKVGRIARVRDLLFGSHG